jgi:hypothetical protein
VVVVEHQTEPTASGKKPPSMLSNSDHDQQILPACLGANWKVSHLYPDTPIFQVCCKDPADVE